MTESEQTSNPMLNDRYELLKKLGSGHTATVYLARDHATETEVAVKIIKSSYYMSN